MATVEYEELSPPVCPEIRLGMNFLCFYTFLYKVLTRRVRELWITDFNKVIL
jgi:hypothetical protein